MASLVLIFGFTLLLYATEPRRAREKANTCFYNLRGIGMALTMYQQDFDDTFPRTWFGQDDGPSDAKHNYKWMDAIFPYLKNEAVFTCPEDKLNRSYRFRNGTNYGSYVMNNSYFKPGDNFTPPAGLKSSQIRNVSGTVQVTDGLNNFQFVWPDAKSTPPTIKNKTFLLGNIQGRHYGRATRPLACGCDGGCSTELSNYHLRTKTINGQTFYPALTVERD